jgi:hypothetical protein
MTRNTDRLEMLARDLASRYGDDDRMVCDIRSGARAKTAKIGRGHSVWRASQKHAFKHARLTKLGICNAA